MADTYRAYVGTPMGTLCFIGDDEAITMAGFSDGPGEDSPDLPAHMLECKRQVEEYSLGQRTSFDLPLRAEGTEFQRAAWKALAEVPYGETISYGQLAAAAGSPRAARAVGNCMAANRLPLIVPCHRVIPASGRLGAFSAPGGPKTKQRLLTLEAENRS